MGNREYAVLGSSPSASVLSSLLLSDVYGLLLHDVYLLLPGLALTHLGWRQSVCRGLWHCIAHGIRLQGIGREGINNSGQRIVMKAYKPYVAQDENVERILVLLYRRRQVNESAYALNAERIKFGFWRIIQLYLLSTSYLSADATNRVILIFNHEEGDGIVNQLLASRERVEAPQETIACMETGVRHHAKIVQIVEKVNLQGMILQVGPDVSRIPLACQVGITVLRGLRIHTHNGGLGLNPLRHFLVDALFESFCQCGSKIEQVEDEWRYRNTDNSNVFRGLHLGL